MPAPDAAAVISFVSERYGITMTGTTTIASMITATVEELEQVTGYKPFVHAGAASSKRVWVRGPRVLLPNGLISITSLVGPTGITYTQGLDYEVGPIEAPYGWIEWLGRSRYPSLPVTITGQWGYATDYPVDIVLAITQAVSARILDQLSQGVVAEGGASWKDGDVSLSNDALLSTSSGAKEAIGVAKGELDRAMNTFKRYARTEVWG